MITAKQQVEELKKAPFTADNFIPFVLEESRVTKRLNKGLVRIMKKPAYVGNTTTDIMKNFKDLEDAPNPNNYVNLKSCIYCMVQGSNTSDKFTLKLGRMPSMGNWTFIRVTKKSYIDDCYTMYDLHSYTYNYRRDTNQPNQPAGPNDENESSFEFQAKYMNTVNRLVHLVAAAKWPDLDTEQLTATPHRF